ncbi:TetR family transcriptional regulator [Oceanospirillaceae bacterium ASx5O]|nr:TetR family transcriptional regulator [Oceanospirillaceae bacterium ASx5O]
MASAPELTNDPQDLQYHGRKASRAKSEHRRRLILEAALRIVVRDGVRGIRHRAVAAEAEVPLAATTYYFRDIDELIVDTFTLYTEKALLDVDDLTRRFNQPWLRTAAADGPDRQAVQDFMVTQVMTYMRHQLLEQRDLRIAEQAFRYEAIINPAIRRLALLHRQALLDKATDFFRHILPSAQPQADAEILLGLFHTLEYNALLQDEGEVELARIEAITRQYLSLILPPPAE